MSTTVVLEELTADDQAELDRLTAIIRRGLESFLEVGRALEDVRERRLYRGSHRTFEEFCQHEFGFKRSYAYEIIQAAKVAELVSGITDKPPPSNVWVMRELVPLCDQPDELRRTWEEAVAEYGDRPTAEQVREIRRSHEPPKIEPEPLTQPAGGGRRDPEHDTRFEVLEDVIELLDQLPPPEQIVFPDEPGDVETIDEAVRRLADWAPRLSRAWRAHKAALKQRC